MDQFNLLYILAQKLLSDNSITTLVAVFEAKVKQCERDQLNKFKIDADNTLKMINGNKQITIKIK